MKKTILAIALPLLGMEASAQTDVTNKYLENADFQARFAAWVNPGSFTYNTASSFKGKSGEIWMEKFVAKGSSLGTNAGIYQTLRDLPTGTYTLVAAAQCVQQSDATRECKGAYLYAGQEQTAITEAGDYSVTFTVVNGKADVGIKLSACNGNWVCVDNFRLYYNGENADSIAAEQARVDEELQALKDKVANATATTLKVTTYDFVPTGNTIALGRSTVSGTHKEKGFCWSTNPEPTIFDEKTTEFFSNNGNIYVMRGLKPSTTYFVRAYAMTNGGYVVYGNQVKINTLPAGTMSYGYFNDNGGDAETCARINSASAECVWMYNNLSYIPGFYLSVHYVPGAGAGDGTADCSYGGWMRVSQKYAYQQTGTMLHETNHGVGVGTTGEWYNNSNLRAETSRGLWLGPMGTKMVRFFENSQTATMTGDGTHMWPYGINGAQEDSYQPSNQCLYYANILITHALHQDGLPCTRDVGFASPAYLFEQDDNTKYYIKNNNASTGMLTGFLYSTASGLKWGNVTAQEAKDDDTYAWYIKYDPKTRYYYFQNASTGKMITYSSGFKVAARTAPTSAERFHLLPARLETTFGTGTSKVTHTAYWILQPNKYSSQALEATASGVTGKTVDLTNGATSQQWMFLTADEIDKFEQAAMVNANKEFTTKFEQIRQLANVPHRASAEEADVTAIDLAFGNALETAEKEAAESVSPLQLQVVTDSLNEAMLTYLANVTPAYLNQPFDLTFLIENSDFDKDATGWSQTATWGNKCIEFYQKNFDFNQTISLKLPAGTYEVCSQAFQRPGTLDDIFQDYMVNNTNKVNAQLYAKTKNIKIKHICEEGEQKSPVSGSTKVGDTNNYMYVPGSMSTAQSWFKKGYYDNSLMLTTGTAASFKLGLRSTSNSGSGYWTIANNIRLYYYGAASVDDVTPVISIEDEAEQDDARIYDLSGRRVSGKPQHGIYILNGKKLAY